MQCHETFGLKSVHTAKNYIHFLEEAYTIDNGMTLALHKAAAATRSRKLLLLTPDGVEPPARLRPKGPKVEVRAVWNWLLEQDHAA